MKSEQNILIFAVSLKTAHMKVCFIKVYNISFLDFILLNCCLIFFKSANNLLFLLCCQAYNSKKLCFYLMQFILLSSSREPAETWSFEILSTFKTADRIID